MHSINNFAANFRKHWTLYSTTAIISTALIILAFYNLGHQFKGLGSLGSTILFTGGISLSILALVCCSRKRKLFFNKIQKVDNYYKLSNDKAEMAAQIMKPGQCLPIDIDGRRWVYFFDKNITIMNREPHKNVVPRSLMTRLINLPHYEQVPVTNDKNLAKYRQFLTGNEFFISEKDGASSFNFKDTVIPQESNLYNGNGKRVRFDVIKLRYSNQMRNISFCKYLQSLF